MFPKVKNQGEGEIFNKYYQTQPNRNFQLSTRRQQANLFKENRIRMKGKSEDKTTTKIQPTTKEKKN